MSDPIFIIKAYRWGWLNDHQYDVAVCTDEGRACELAREEADDRGGKYGVQVVCWNGETSSRPVAYFASSYGESEPRHNWRINMFESLGQDVHWVARQQKVRDGAALDAVTWATQVVCERESMAKFMAQVQARALDNMAQGCTSDEQMTRALADKARIDEEVRRAYAELAAAQKAQAGDGGDGGDVR